MVDTLNPVSYTHLMQVEYDNQIYYGFGANTDIIAASVEAYIDCINTVSYTHLSVGGLLSQL